MLHATAHRYIVTDDAILGGEPIIAGTRTSVRAIVELWRQGVAPEHIPSQLPHLTLAQVFDALSYYSDHQDEITAAITRNRIPEAQLDPLVRSS
jgi:uncharacterized protein (DUF433 family)